MVEIAIPGPTVQHEKTPAFRRVRRLDEKGTPYYTVEHVTVGTGEAAQVLRWHELVMRVKIFIETRTVAECKTLFEELTGNDYDGLGTNKAVLRAIMQFYLGFTGDDTTANLLQRFAEDVRQEGRWGLGCPHGCGRFWEYKSTADLTGFMPSDPAAMAGVDEEGEPTKGYLNWGSSTFTCDRCGGEVKLG